MKIEVVMPKMGESLQEGTVTKWLKKEGDKIERDEMILEISTDKVDTEVPSPNAGILSKILVQEQETVEVGTPIAIIETDAEAAASDNSGAKSNEEEKPTPNEDPQQKPVEEPSEKPNEDPNNIPNEIPGKTPQESPDSFPNEEKKISASQNGKSSQSNSGSNHINVVMPKMGESLQEGTVIKWLKKAGESVERDEMILEISTDKVDTEVPSPVSGTLAEILVKEGETVEVGVVIAKISTGNADSNVSENKNIPAAQDETSTSGSEKSQAVSNNNTNGSVQQLAVSVPAGGGTKEIPSRKGDMFFSPLVRTIAKENDISLEELEQIQGKGVQGRITKDDLNKYIENRKTQPKEAPKTVSEPKSQPSQPAAASQPVKAPVYAMPSGDDVEIIPMDRIRQLISEHMVYSKHTSAHVTSVAEVDVTNIVKLREKFKNEFEKKEGFKLTYTPFFAKAAVDAIRQFPMVNVSVNGKNILKHKRINLGIATALPDGNLIVPVIKNSEVLNITGLARSVYDLSSRARNKKLQPDEIQGGTFTLTNVGTFGTLFGTPVINQPQCGIFGVGAIKKRAVVKEVEGNDLILVRHMMYCSITYDHRVIDGMLAGQTLAAFVKSLENMNENTITL